VHAVLDERGDLEALKRLLEEPAQLAGTGQQPRRGTSVISSRSDDRSQTPSNDSGSTKSIAPTAPLPL